MTDAGLKIEMNTEWIEKLDAGSESDGCRRVRQDQSIIGAAKGMPVC